MKLSTMLAFGVGALALALPADARSARREPGYCKDDKDCTEESPDYTCVSVQTTRAGVEDVKQCLPYKTPGDVCSGKRPGLCPMFSTWKDEYKSISSVCAFIIPNADCIPEGETGGSSKKNQVACLNVTESSSGSGSDDPEKIGVIYGCVDFDGQTLLYEKNSVNMDLVKKFNYTAIIKDKCVNPDNQDGSDVVCSGRGTCAPQTAGQMNYQCDCNVGYNGTYCEGIESNKCTTKVQCQAGVCNLETQECECPKGTTGDQCAECDPKYKDACNGHGTCKKGNPAVGTGNGSGSISGSTIKAPAEVGDSDKNMCECEDGYAGAQCDRKVKKSKSSSDGDADEGSGSDGASTVLASSFVAVLSAAALVMA